MSSVNNDVPIPQTSNDEKSKTSSPQTKDAKPNTSDKPLQDTKAAPTNAQPLAPPPKPSQNPTDTPDYFSAAVGGSHFSLEPNPFEQSFGNPSTDTPGKFTGLPSVASLTSPAPLGAAGSTPGWGGSLRAGPLSPAMLAGPTGSAAGYFDEGFRGSFPTPNESSLRTGLTPGGGGSMFPAPSPNSQAIYNSLQSGGATPGTLDFQRAAMNAAARSKVEPGSQPMGQTAQGINKQEYQPAQPQQQPGHPDVFGNHPESEAVNSLYMLAQTGNRNANQFAVPSQPTSIGNGSHLRGGAQNQEQSPTAQRGTHQSSLSGSGNGGEDAGDYSDNSVDAKPAMARSKSGKRGSTNKVNQNNGRRKADNTPAKGNNKRAKISNGSVVDMDNMEGLDSDDAKDDMETTSGRKMTDDEKRRNFLERNRVAALKCRQRKKQWLANLQTKVEIYTSENDALTTQCTQLREEIVNLKTLLIAHKDCAVSHQQGLGGNAMAQVIGDFNPQGHHYGMPMPNGGSMMNLQQQPQQGMQRR